MELHTIGIDLGRTVFHLVGLNQRGEVVVRKKFSRKQLLHFTANLQVKLIGMEACGGAHFLGRTLREQGHEVRLMPAQYVKPYVKTNKSDYIDAEAIAEAVERPKMRFVPIKSDDQLDLQSLHRVRERWVMRRTAVINQIRGLLLERGITLRQGRRHVDAALPGILEDACAKLSGAVRVLLMQLKLERRLPTAGSDPWHRTCDGNRHHRRDRQRSSFQKGARVFRVARNRPGRIHHGWQAKVAGD
jgi:transposase